MLRLFKVLYELLLKCCTVKGVLFFTSLYLCLDNKLEGLYVFIAGALWVSARELYKQLIKNKLPKEGVKSE